MHGQERQVAADAATSLWEGGPIPTGARRASAVMHGESDYGSPTDLRKPSLRVFRQRAGKALNHKQVSGALGILNHDVRRAVMALMEELAEKGQLEDLGRGRYVMAAPEFPGTSQAGKKAPSKFPAWAPASCAWPTGTRSACPRTNGRRLLGRHGGNRVVAARPPHHAPREARHQAVCASTTW